MKFNIDLSDLQNTRKEFFRLAQLVKDLPDTETALLLSSLWMDGFDRGTDDALAIIKNHKELV